MRIAYHRSTKDPDEIVRRYSNNAPTRQDRAVNLALKTFMGESIPLNLVVVSSATKKMFSWVWVT